MKLEMITEARKGRKVHSIQRDKSKDPVVKKRNVASLEMRDMRGSGAHQRTDKKASRAKQKQSFKQHLSKMDY